MFECKGMCEGSSQSIEKRKYNVRKFCSVCDTWLSKMQQKGIRCFCCNTKARQTKKRRGIHSPEVARY